MQAHARVFCCTDKQLTRHQSVSSVFVQQGSTCAHAQPKHACGASTCTYDRQKRWVPAAPSSRCEPPPPTALSITLNDVFPFARYIFLLAGFVEASVILPRVSHAQVYTFALNVHYF